MATLDPGLDHQVCLTCTPSGAEESYTQCYSLTPVPEDKRNATDLRLTAASAPTSAILLTMHGDDGIMHHEVYESRFMDAAVSTEILFKHPTAGRRMWAPLRCDIDPQSTNTLWPVADVQVYTSDGDIFDLMNGQQGMLAYGGHRSERFVQRMHIDITNTIAQYHAAWSKSPEGAQCLRAHAQDDPGTQSSLSLPAPKAPYRWQDDWWQAIQLKATHNRFSMLGKRQAHRCLDGTPPFLGVYLIPQLSGAGAFAAYYPHIHIVEVYQELLDQPEYREASDLDMRRIEQAVVAHEICGHARYATMAPTNDFQRGLNALRDGLPLILSINVQQYLFEQQTPNACLDSFVGAMLETMGVAEIDEGHVPNASEFYARLHELESYYQSYDRAANVLDQATPNMRFFIDRAFEHIERLETHFTQVYSAFPALAFELRDLYRFVLTDPLLSPSIKRFGLSRILRIAAAVATNAPTAQDTWAIPPLACPQLEEAPDAPAHWCDFSSMVQAARLSAIDR